jgi:hypothetical protein
MAAALTGLGFPADLGPEGHRWGGDLPCGAWPGTRGGAVDLSIPDAVPPEALIDPRFSDAIEVLFSNHAQDLGLRPHVARPWRVSA